ncbi:unnamed protein product [Lactuca virosa]|uniref:Uncharacterized protein n=1 Tax=Lactuca virosa TaxID=75947 RepID=A0AAU9N8G9_9ASTR|nr:unnamed protein product [Lactuca virosa]
MNTTTATTVDDDLTTTANDEPTTVITVDDEFQIWYHRYLFSGVSSTSPPPDLKCSSPDLRQTTTISVTIVAKCCYIPRTAAITTEAPELTFYSFRSVISSPPPSNPVQQGYRLGLIVLPFPPTSITLLSSVFVSIAIVNNGFAYGLGSISPNIGPNSRALHQNNLHGQIPNENSKCLQLRAIWNFVAGGKHKMLRAGGYFVRAAEPVYKHEDKLEEQWEQFAAVRWDVRSMKALSETMLTLSHPIDANVEAKSIRCCGESTKNCL